jgi:hypothetical protein
VVAVPSFPQMPHLPAMPQAPQAPQAPAAPPLPPACADCMTTQQLAQAGAIPKQTPSQMFRAPDGKMRVDTGATSIITDPASQKAMVLDHVKKVAHMVPLPQAPQMPQAPQLPGMPGGLPSNMPKPPQVEDLGKGFIEGHPVDGKKYTFHPPDMPKLPDVPKPPSLAKPAIPGMPAAPAIPASPPMPTVAEVWTSTETKMPVLTKVTGPFGQQICHCKPGSTAPPNPAMFQVPPGYKVT